MPTFTSACGSDVQSQRLQLSDSAAVLEAAEAKAVQQESDLVEARRTIASLEEDILATEKAAQGEGSGAPGDLCPSLASCRSSADQI